MRVKSVFCFCSYITRCYKNEWILTFLLFVLTGVLLFGPPGCGKTMIAKATARASGCRFINLQASTLTDMWYGESQKLTAAVFSLAVKIQPCIIFIDEIGKLHFKDAFLKSKILVYCTVRCDLFIYTDVFNIMTLFP